MKKIFMLGLLITPIMAHATDPVGPAAVGQGQTAVVATASAPYITATPAPGDSTQVVSASYVKGAYNDAIAAVNKVAESVNDVADNLDNLSSYVNNDIEDEIADKQDKLSNASNNHSIESKVVAGSDVSGWVVNTLPYVGDDDEYTAAKSFTATNLGIQNMDDALISAGVVLDGLHGIAKYKQDTLTSSSSGNEIFSEVATADYIDDLNHSVFDNNGLTNVLNDFDRDMADADDVIMSAGGVLYLANGAKEYTDSAISGKRVNALATWGSNTVTKVPLVNNQ